jgi:alkaline phosphatase D
MKKLSFLSLLLGLFTALVSAQPVKINNTNLPFDPHLKPFYHGVSSGDPLTDRVIIWTRVTPEVDSAVHVTYFVATDPSFQHIVTTGSTTADTTRDYTVKIDVQGLSAGTTYYYYFNALGRNSLIGRTKTVPMGDNSLGHLRFAVISCNNYDGGFFNAFGRISERNDLDAIIHLGDYIYELAPGGFRNASLGNTRNDLQPTHEIINEADYRTRYSLYRLDPDLQKAHQQHPFISIWDDHEFVNNAWDSSAPNYTPANQSAWLLRKNIAKKVYFEWVPIRDNATEAIYRKISYGNLMDLFMLDTRLDGRSAPPAHFDDPDVPMRKMISDTQFNWLLNGLATSPAKWKVIGNQVIFSDINVGFIAGATSIPSAFDPTDITKIRAVQNNFSDNWASHPTQRAQLIDSIKNKKINNVIFVSGTSHCSWAFDVTKTPCIYPNSASFNLPLPSPIYDRISGTGSVAVELGVPGISSQNFDERQPLATAEIFQFELNAPFNLQNSGLGKQDTALNGIGDVYYNPHMKYVDLVQEGYMILDIKKDSSQGDWFYVNVLDSISKIETNGQIGPYRTSITSAIVKDKQNKVLTSSSISKPKAQQDIPAPSQPLSIVTGYEEDSSPSNLLISMFPNPAKDYVMLNFGVLKTTHLTIEIVDLSGKKIKTLSKAQGISSGNYLQEFSVKELKAGIYFLQITTENQTSSRKLVVE